MTAVGASSRRVGGGVTRLPHTAVEMRAAASPSAPSVDDHCGARGSGEPERSAERAGDGDEVGRWGREAAITGRRATRRRVDAIASCGRRDPSPTRCSPRPTPRSCSPSGGSTSPAPSRVVSPAAGWETRRCWGRRSRGRSSRWSSPGSARARRRPRRRLTRSSIASCPATPRRDGGLCAKMTNIVETRRNHDLRSGVRGAGRASSRGERAHGRAPVAGARGPRSSRAVARLLPRIGRRRERQA
jgi:hypothetical protein